MKLRLVVVGRDRNDPLVEAADLYLDRIRRHLSVEVQELKEVPLKKTSDPDRVMAAEGERILGAVGPGERLIALDRTGRELDSTQVADRLDSAMQSGGAGLAFVIGGPLGLHRSVLDVAQERWSLSRMTLPHRLARLVLSEQLYRGLSILRGEPYHK